MHTTETHASHDAPALPCSRSGQTTATGQCSRAVLRFESVTASPGPAAQLRHTYAVVGAVDRATPSTTPNRPPGRPSPLATSRTRPSAVNSLRSWP
jgi:hypothetical protein